MDPSGKSKGPPPAVKKVLSLFGSGKEEDRMVGYLSFLKIGPKLLRFLPGTLLASELSAVQPSANAFWVHCCSLYSIRISCICDVLRSLRSRALADES